MKVRKKKAIPRIGEVSGRWEATGKTNYRMQTPGGVFTIPHLECTCIHCGCVEDMSYSEFRQQTIPCPICDKRPKEVIP